MNIGFTKRNGDGEPRANITTESETYPEFLADVYKKSAGEERCVGYLHLTNVDDNSRDGDCSKALEAISALLSVNQEARGSLGRAMEFVLRKVFGAGQDYQSTIPSGEREQKLLERISFMEQQAANTQDLVRQLSASCENYRNTITKMATKDNESEDLISRLRVQVWNVQSALELGWLNPWRLVELPQAARNIVAVARENGLLPEKPAPR